ncbi:MAG TPA: transaldolase family protein [Tepidisphaeraceae bacterium]|nr:transaldolase family protein [Tepidisphaeraceae bacterium]
MSLKSLVATGTKVWSDSIDPEIVKAAPAKGISGATSNPIIIADIIKKGGFDQRISELIEQGMDDSAIAWQLDDELVANAERVFRPTWERTGGNDGYVSFELDPLLEDTANPVPLDQAVRKYLELGKRWGLGHDNRMIKVPATEAGLAALEELAAEGITLNVTLCFTERQYVAARDAVWRGVQRAKRGLDRFKSVYSIFISRVDVYTAKNVPELSKEAQGKVGLVNAKLLWQANQAFWKDKGLKLQQEIIFASTGKKLEWQSEDYYVEQLAGSDIQTNPPETNDWVERADKRYARTVDQLPPAHVVDEIRQKVDPAKLERTLMQEGTKKFADPQKALEKQIGQRRTELAAAR